MTERLKTVFYGSSGVSLKYLEYLYGSEDIVAVVTAPPAPAGRGLKVKESPVEKFAREKNILCLTPPKLTGIDIFSKGMSRPDFGVVVAYGKILPLALIEYPERGTINVHFSLLPKYRGAAPIQRTLINGEKQTGVTIFCLDEGMDTGKILAVEEIPVFLEDNTVTLGERLSALGIGLLGKTLDLVKKGGVHGVPQSGAPSYAPALRKEDGKIDWKKTAAEVSNLVRGTYPWPGAYGELNAGGRKIRLNVTEAEAFEVCPGDEKTCPVFASPGDITGFVSGTGFVVKCSRGVVLLKRVKPEGKKEMSAWDFMQGAKITRDDKFS